MWHGRPHQVWRGRPIHHSHHSEERRNWARLVPANPRLVSGQKPTLRAGSAAQAAEPQPGRATLSTQQRDQDHHPDALRSHLDPLVYGRRAKALKNVIPLYLDKTTLLGYTAHCQSHRR